MWHAANQNKSEIVQKTSDFYQTPIDTPFSVILKADFSTISMKA